MSPREASLLTGIGLTRLYELLKDGTIKSSKVGRKRLISFASLESLVTDRSEASGTGYFDAVAGSLQNLLDLSYF